MKFLTKTKKSIIIISMVIVILLNSCIMPRPVQANWKDDVAETLLDIFFGGMYWLTVGVYQHINNFFVSDTYKIDVDHWGDVPRDEATEIGLTPENIIKGEFILFDANIFMDLNSDPEAKNKFDYDDSAGANGYVIKGKSEMRDIVAGWYYSLRNFSIIAFLSVLVYVAIRMIMSSISQDKAKYKTMFKDWLVALCLLIVMNYLMVGILNFTSMITKAIGSGKTSSTLTQNIAYDLYQFKEHYARDNALDTSSDKKKVHYEFTDDPDATEENWTTATFLTYILCFAVMAIYTMIFTVKYLKREFTIIFLVLLGPISCITYPIDKISDGKAQAFNKWLTEFIYQVLIQPFHLLLYIVLVGTATTLAGKNILYCIVCFAVLLPAEKFIKSMFGFKDTLGSPLQGMMKMDMFRNLLGGGPGFGGGGNKSPKEKDVPDDTDKPQRSGPTFKNVDDDDDGGRPLPGGGSDDDNQPADDGNGGGGTDDDTQPVDDGDGGAPLPPPGPGPDTEEEPTGERPTSERPTGERPTNEMPTGERPTGERSTNEMPTEGERPTEAEKPTSERQTGERPTSERPTGERPTESPRPNPQDHTTDDRNDGANDNTGGSNSGSNGGSNGGSDSESGRHVSVAQMVGNRFTSNKNPAARVYRAIRSKHVARRQARYGTTSDKLIGGFIESGKKRLWRGTKFAGRLAGRTLKGATTLGLKLTGAAVGGVLGAMVGQGQAGAAAGMRIGGRAANVVNDTASEIASSIGDDIATGYNELMEKDPDRDKYFKDKKKIALAKKVYEDRHDGKKVTSARELRKILGQMYKLEQFRGINGSNVRDYTTQYMGNKEFIESMSDADKQAIISQLDPASIADFETPEEAINMLMLNQSKTLSKRKAEDFRSLSKLQDMADEIAIPGLNNSNYYQQILNNGSRLADDGNEIRPELLRKLFGPNGRRRTPTGGNNPQNGTPSTTELPPSQTDQGDRVVDVPIVNPPFTLTEPNDKSRYGKMVYRLQQQGFDESQIQGIVSGTESLSDLEDSVDFIMGNGREYKAARDAASAFLGPDATKAQIDDEMYRRLLLKKAGIGLDKLDRIRSSENMLDDQGLLDARAIANAAKGSRISDEEQQRLIQDYTNAYAAQGLTSREASSRAEKAVRVAKLYQMSQSDNPADIKIPLNIGSGSGVSRPEIGRIGSTGAGAGARIIAGIQLQGQGISSNSAGYEEMVDSLLSPTERVSVVTELEGGGVRNPSNAQIDDAALGRVVSARNVARQYDLSGASTEYISGQLRRAGIGEEGLETARNLVDRLNRAGVKPSAAPDYTALQQDISRRTTEEISRLTELEGTAFVQELDRLGIGHEKDSYTREEVRTTVNAANAIKSTKIPSSLGNMSKGTSREVRDITVQLKVDGYSEAQIERFGEIAKKAGGSEKEIVERYRAISNFVKGDTAKKAADNIAGEKASQQVKKSEIVEIVSGSKGSFEESAIAASVAERKKKLSTGRQTTSQT